MNFNFDVKSKSELAFNPSRLDIYIGEKSVEYDGTEFLNVQTVLTETTPKGSNVATANHVFPVAMLQPVIKEFKLGETKPEVDLVKLGELLEGFDLMLTPAP